MRGRLAQYSEVPSSPTWLFFIRLWKTLETALFKLLEILQIYRPKRSLLVIPSLALTDSLWFQAVLYNGTQDEILGFTPRRWHLRILRGLPDIEMCEKIRFEIIGPEGWSVNAVGSTEGRGFVKLKVPRSQLAEPPEKLYVRAKPAGIETLLGDISLGDYEIDSAPVFFLSQKVKRVLISDIDDTIKDSNILKSATPKAILSSIIRGNYYSYDVIEGMPELYQELASEGWLIVYVTSTPFQLSQFLLKFLTDSRFPEGPVFPRWLRHGKVRHKWQTIRQILNSLPSEIPATLIGDSGEKDLHIYRRVVSDPELNRKIENIMIRHVPGTPMLQPLESRETIYKSIDELRVAFNSVRK